MGSANSGSKSYVYDNDNDDDIFGLKKTKNDDVFGSFISPPKKSDSVDDLFGGFGGGSESKSKSLKQDEAGYNDLIPGFAASTSPNNGTNVKATKSAYLSVEDPFVVLESTSSPSYGYLDLFSDPLDELGKLTQSGGRMPDGASKTTTTLEPPPKPSQVLKSDKGHLLDRWRLGGGCDCGGWDMACPLTVFNNPNIRCAEDKPLLDNQQPFELFVQGAKENTPALTMIFLKDGQYAVDFHAQLFVLQAFSICITTLHGSEASIAAGQERSTQLPHCNSLKLLIEDEVKFLIETATEEKKKFAKWAEDIPESYIINPPFSPIARV